MVNLKINPTDKTNDVDYQNILEMQKLCHEKSVLIEALKIVLNEN